MSPVYIGTEKCHKVSEAVMKSMSTLNFNKRKKNHTGIVIESEKYHNSVKCIVKSMKQKIVQINDDVEKILSICRYVQSIMSVTHKGTEKYHKVSEA